MDKLKKSGLVLGFIFIVSAVFFIEPSGVISQEIKYPTRPIKLIVNFAAGGPTDITCRKLADLAKNDLGQEVIVENKVGAGGLVGVRFAVKSKPDGYTIGSLTASPVVIAPSFQDMDFNPATDLTPIVQYATADHPLAVPADSPIKNFKDFVQEAKKREITCASMELTAVSMSLMYLASVEKLKLKIIPFGGTAPAVTAVLGGHTDAVAVSGIYEYVRSGKLRLLAQTGGYKNKEFPGIATLKELGYDIETVAFYGLIAPKGIPGPIKEKLEGAFTKAIQDPSFPQIVQNASYSLVYNNSKDFGSHIKEAYEKSQKILKELGLGKYAKEKK